MEVHTLGEGACGILAALSAQALLCLELHRVGPLYGSEHIIKWEASRGHLNGHDTHAEDACLHQVPIHLLLITNCLLQPEYFEVLSGELLEDLSEQTLCAVLKTIAEEAQRARQLILLGIRRVHERLGERFDEPLLNLVAANFRHRAKADTSDLHHVRDDPIDALNILIEFFDVFLRHLTALRLELFQTLSFVLLDDRDNIGEEVEHLKGVLVAEPLYSLLVIEVLDAPGEL